MLLRRILDIVFPRFCLLCGARLDANADYLCGHCYELIEPLGLDANPEDNYMARLLWGHFTPERCVSLMRHHKGSEAAQMIYRLKYSGSWICGIALGVLAVKVLNGEVSMHCSLSLTKPLNEGRVVHPFFEGIDVILPMPLHKNRQGKRGYNQSEMIARGISEETGLPIINNAVARIKDNKTQTECNAFERWENVDGIFKVLHPEQVENRHILIVDDVMTVGATISSLGSELKKCKNVKISVLTIALSTERIFL